MCVRPSRFQATRVSCQLDDAPLKTQPNEAFAARRSETRRNKRGGIDVFIVEFSLAIPVQTPKHLVVN